MEEDGIFYGLFLYIVFVLHTMSRIRHRKIVWPPTLVYDLTMAVLRRSFVSTGKLLLFIAANLVK